MTGRVQRLINVHGGLWFEDPWYRRCWFLWPQAAAVTIAILLVVPRDAPISPVPIGDWASPVRSAMSRKDWIALRERAQSDDQKTRELKDDADRGDPGAQTAMGELLDPFSPNRSKILSSSGVEAFAWWEKAAEQGDALAQFEMAYVLLNADEWGVKKNDAAIFPWAERSSDQGVVSADRLLGYLYMSGKGIPVDFKKGFEFLSRAANKGEPDAQWMLGFAYENGQGTAVNLRDSVIWFRRSAQSGNKIGFEKLAAAAASGDTDAQWMLGIAYELGQGTPINKKSGADWLQKSAASGNVEGINNFGVALEKGDGIDRDTERARTLFKRAIAAGDKAAESNLSRLPPPPQ